MNFFINQNSEEPSLKLRLIDDGIYDKNKFNNMLVDSVVTLDMFDSQGNPILLDSPCVVVTSYTKFNHLIKDYAIIHKFNKRSTRNKGVFEAKITIKFNDTPIVPDFFTYEVSINTTTTTTTTVAPTTTTTTTVAPTTTTTTMKPIIINEPLRTLILPLHEKLYINIL